MRIRRLCLAAALAGTMLFPLPAFSQMFSNLFSPLLQAWVRSQVQQVDDLQVNVVGPDAAVMNGQISRVDISGRNLVYQGISARSLSMRGSDIRLDTRQGLRLTKAVRADVALSLSEGDINNYLASPAFQEQTKNWKIKLPGSLGGAEQEVPIDLSNARARVLRNQLEINATVRLGKGEPAPLRIVSGLEIANPHQLRLVDPRLVADDGNSAPIDALKNTPILLGKDLEMRRLNIVPGMVFLEGSFQIQATPTANQAI
ncbi:MAG: DUF2993 domain-containing protein [Anaerolineae bacterium]|nr:DUF2993 domain-containing protein [Gloeobacterales cyanobacterium ES-bin-313]